MEAWAVREWTVTGDGMARRQRATAASGGNHERMSAVDTAWLRMDGPAGAMLIVSVIATATPVRAAELRRVLETRLLCFPRFRRRVEADPLGASWIDDDDIDLDAHFVVTRLPDKGGKHELQALAARLAAERLDPSRPLWQIHFVERYGSGSAWILRLHHCYADGIAMIRVLLSLTEQDAGPALAGAQDAESRAGQRRDQGTTDPPPLRDWINQFSQPAGDILEHALAEGARLLEAGVHRLFHPDTAATVALQASGMVGEFAKVLALPDDPASPLRASLSGEKGVAWSEPLDLREVKTVSRALGCTVNDVLMATVAGTLGAYLREEHEFDTTGVVLRASVPVNLRAAEETMTLGNKFGLMFVDLPVGVANPLQRAYAMHDTMRELKGSLQPQLTLTVLGTLGMLPAVAQGPAIELFSRKGSLVASNVPGPQTPLCICGQRISEMYFWVPQSGSIGVGVSILSYAGKVFFGLIADRACVAEPQRVVDRLGPEFEQLLLAATVGALGLEQRNRATKSAGKPRQRKRRATPTKARRKTRPPAGNT